MGFGSVGVKEFIKLDDTPASYAGEAGKVAAVKVAEDALEFILAGASNFLALTDTPASYAGEAGKVATVKAAEDALEFIAGAAATFLALTDTPASYVGQGGKVAAVKVAEDALEFILAGVSNFLALTDTPASYAGSGGLVAVVKAAENGLEFSSVVPVAGFGDNFIITKIPADTLDSPIWDSDQITFSIAYLNHQLIVESELLWVWQTHYDFTLIFNALRGSRTAAALTGFFGMNKEDADIISHPENNSVGLWYSNNRWYAHNGNGTSYTRTSIDTLYCDWPICVRIEKTAGKIEWYVRGALKVTHTTNIPDQWYNMKEHYSCRSDNNIRHDITCQRIKYFPDIIK